MIAKEVLSVLVNTKDTVVTDGIDECTIQGLESNVQLPKVHLDFLRITNGITLFGGYFRLFGYLSPIVFDMVQWNSPELWTFAWRKPLQDFWFIGETAWGDQYAYRKDELLGPMVPKVYFLEGLTMAAEVIAGDFNEFVERELYRNAVHPYDVNLIEARKNLGELDPFEHVAYVPSPLVSGEECSGSLSKLDAVVSMVINGDLCTQMENQTQDRAIMELQTYVDSKCRTRLRVIWD